MAAVPAYSIRFVGQYKGNKRGGKNPVVILR